MLSSNDFGRHNIVSICLIYKGIFVNKLLTSKLAMVSFYVKVLETSDEVVSVLQSVIVATDRLKNRHEIFC